MKPNASCMTKCPEQAAQWIEDGKLLAYPTESVWGIGCDPYNQAAVAKILEIKNRPIEKGMIVVTDSIDRLEPLLARLKDSRRQQVIASWQETKCQDNASQHQAITWLLPLISSETETKTKTETKKDIETDASIDRTSQHGLPKWITGKHNSVAVRVIVHPLIRKLCQNMVSRDNPYGLLVSTSCNPSQLAPATTFSQAFKYFENDICYLQGETLGYTLPSQIKDANTGATIR